VFSNPEVAAAPATPPAMLGMLAWGAPGLQIWRREWGDYRRNRHD